MSDLRWRRQARLFAPRVAEDVDDELRFHLEERAAELVAAGMPPDQARAAAAREFGDVERARAECRAIGTKRERRLRRLRLFDNLRDDLRDAARALRRSPGFAAVVAVTLALGLGVNSTVFSIVNGFLFRPLPVPAGRELVVVGERDPSITVPHEMSYRNYVDVRDMRGVFAEVAGYYGTTVSLSDGARAERVYADVVTANYFRALRLEALAGRTFLPDEDQGALAHPVVVLSYAFWMRHFGGDARVVGDTIRIGGQPATIVGVAPRGFEGVSSVVSVDLFVPVNQVSAAGSVDREVRGDPLFNVVGRLTPGVSVARARAAVVARARQLAAAYPKTNQGLTFVLVPEVNARPALALSAVVPRGAAVFMALVGLVLLAACANVANLLLVRAAARRRELAVRAALGAGRWRLVRHALIECVVLATLGGAGAVALAVWTTRVFASIRPPVDVPVRFPVQPDWRVMLFTVAITVVAVLAAGLLPALRGTRVDPQDALRGGARGSAGRGHRRLRAVLVAAQVAVGCVVLVCAALFARSGRNARRMDFGFRIDHLLMASMSPGSIGFDSTHAATFRADLLRRAAQLPGVRSAALGVYVPFGYNNDRVRVFPEGTSVAVPPTGIGMFHNVVTPGYLATVGTTIVAGRDFTDADIARDARVAIVSARAAEALWGGGTRDVVGRRFRLVHDGEPIEVVGVARTTQYMTVGEPAQPFLYLPMPRQYRGRFTLHLRTAGDPAAMVPATRALVASLAPDLPLYDVRTMEAHVTRGRALVGVRMGAMFSAVFGLLALALSAVGLYGVVSYAVAGRTQEIGIRMALGARVPSILALVAREGFAAAAVGLAIGLGVAALIAGAVRSLLYDVAPIDPLVFGGVSIVLGLVAVLAGIIPARRAARVDPVVALRAE